MKNLIDLCIRRPVSVIMFLATLFLGGLFSLSVLPVQKLPEFIFPRITVETLYPGLGAEDIRSSLTIPVEDALSSIKGLERMRSISRDGASLTVLDFRWGTDSGAASVLVREAIDAVYPSLPEGAARPMVIPGDPDEQAQMIVAVRSHLGPAFARNVAEYELCSFFRRIDGVGAVLLSGGEREELTLKVDLPRSLSRALPTTVLAEIIAAEIANVPAGNAREGDRELVVVSKGKPETEAELEKMIFPSRNGSFVISDIGSITRTRAKKESLFIVGSAECTALEIFRRPGANPVKLSRDLRKAAAEASAVFGRDAEILIIYDDAASIIPGIQKLLFSVVLGIAAVMGVLFFTLQNFRYSILAGLSLPFSMAASIAVLAVSGRSINNMSLSGIALGVGLVSDTAVIILDLLNSSLKKTEKPSRAELGSITASVAASSFGGAATTAVVFIPVIFLPGPLGSLFGDLSAALVVSILAGWIYAQFALPSLFGMFCLTGNNTRNCKKNPEGKNYFDVFLAVRYAQLLRNCLQKPVHVFGITALLCATGLALLVTRPSSFVSSDLVSEIEVVLNFPPGTTIDSIAAEAAVLGEQLEALPGIVSVFGRGGSEKEDAARRSNPDYRKETFVFRCVIGTSNNSPRVVKPETVLASINTLLGKQYYETLARFPQDKTEKLLGLSPVSVIAVKGRNMEDLKRRAAETETLIQMNGLTFSRRPWGLRPEIRVIPDREASAHAGISAMETARALYAAAEGLELGKLELGGTPLTIKISAMDLPELEVLPVALSLNGPVFAGSIARFIPNETPAALARLDRSDVLYFECNPGSSVSHFAGGKELGLSRVDESAFTRYRTSLIVTVVMVLILLYLTMGAEFESLSLPLVLFLAIPFSLAGAGPALFLCNAGLDSSSILALMVLFGLSVNNGMVLYELALVKYSYGRFTVGRSAMEAVYDATVERFRPVLTTTLTTVFALLPLVISPMGTKEHSMAAAMLGGIAASTTLTLFALPPVLTGFLDRNRNL